MLRTRHSPVVCFICLSDCWYDWHQWTCKLSSTQKKKKKKKKRLIERTPSHPAEPGFPCLCRRALPSCIPSTSPTWCCVAGGLEFGAGSIHVSVSVRGHRPASGVRLVVSLPFRRAIARLVPNVCETLPPREGGLHVRLSHRIVHHAMAKQLPLS